MKIKYWVVTLFVCLVVGLGSMISLLRQGESVKVDMVDINERYQEVSKRLTENVPAMEEAVWEALCAELEQSFDCKIYRRTDFDYETKVNNAIRNQEVVLDLVDGTVREGKLEGKIVFPGQQETLREFHMAVIRRCLFVFVFEFVVIVIFLAMIYRQYMRPFKKLEKFAGCISKGNFDMPLPMEKGNYFGAFTESFDMMREEMKRARQSEYEANTSKKELVASLSHDIKTPVATIKAICELLELKVTTEAENARIQVIEQKADMIDQLISNMFQSTLADLEKLKIEPTEEMSTVLEPMFREINYYNKIHLLTPIPECVVRMDVLRLNQVIDNLVNNSYKYANTDIDVSFERVGQELQITMQDHGPGIDEEELPLVMEKFYRGENAKGKDGSGLGLYLSKTFMEGMGGSLKLENHAGLRVQLRIPLCMR